MHRLAVAECRGGFRLHEVVDAGAAAAHVRLGNLDEGYARNRGQQLSWLSPDSLRVCEMTGIVVRHRRGDRIPGRARLAELDEQLRDVPYHGTEPLRPRRP